MNKATKYRRPQSKAKHITSGCQQFQFYTLYKTAFQSITDQP